MKKKSHLLSFFVVAAVFFSTANLADDANKSQAELKQKLVGAAGPSGPFARKEDFPKSYFLIPQNLPFMVGLSLHHPMSKSLILSSVQKHKIKQIKENTVPVVVKAAKQIKRLELALAQQFIDGASPFDMDSLVDEISVLRTALPKKHIRCIHQLRTILTGKQFAILQGFAAGNINNSIK